MGSTDTSSPGHQAKGRAFRERKALGQDMNGRKLPTMVGVLLGFLAFGVPDHLAGQVSVTVGGVQAEAGREWGADARLWINPPLSPVGGYLGADYFLSDCFNDCGPWGLQVGGFLRSSFPVLQPYVTGAYVVRNVKADGETSNKSGLSLGVGARLTRPMAIYAEASREFLGSDLKGWFFRIGFGL